MNQNLQITREQSINVMHFQLPNTMDTMEIDDLTDAALACLNGRDCEMWVLDMREVEYMGSSVLGLMVNIRERIREGSGKLILCGLSARLLHIFRTSCLEQLFVVTKTKEDAFRRIAR